jgi:transcription initiation factor TFIIB
MSLRDIYEDGFDESIGKTTPTSQCPECDGRLLTDAGERRCDECGLVVDEHRVDHGAEWTSYDDSTAKRTGAPLTPARHDRGLSTEIGIRRDARGTPLSATMRRRLTRQRRLHKRSKYQTKAERNLAYACTEIARMTGALGLSRAVREEACTIYRLAQDAGLIVGRSIEALAAGSLYAACRCWGYTRTPDEVASVARCDLDAVRVGYRVVNVELDLATQVMSVADRIPKLATAFDATDDVRYRAAELAAVASTTGIDNGRNPSGVAGACLYLAGRELGVKYTQAAVAEEAGVTPVTLRKRFYELREEVAIS